MRWLILVLFTAVLGCGDGDRSVSPAGKATTDCSLADILAGTCGDTADPTLDVVPEGYEAPVDSTASADAPTEDPVIVEPVVKEPVSDTDLHEAAWAGHLEEVQYLVEGQGLDMNARDDRGFTALHFAAWAGHLEVVQYLVGQGASVTATFYGGTALHFAAAGDHLAVVQYLVEQGASVTATDNSGNTALHLAVRRGHLSVVRHLVEEHGAAVNATDNEGWTPLHHAAGRGHLSVVRYLVENGADVDATDDYGTTPRDLSDGDVEEYLESVGG